MSKPHVVTPVVELLPPDDFVEELRSLTLDELLSSMNQVQRLMEYPDESFDSKSIVGEMVLNPDASVDARNAIRNKVDSLHYVIGEFDAFSKREEIRAKRHAAKSARAKRHAQSIRDQIKFVMDTNGFEKLTGNEFVIQKTPNTMANCTLMFDREPDAADMVQFNFVEEIPATYSWKTSEIKKKLKEFHVAMRGAPACDVCKGKKLIPFNDAMITCDECAGVGAKIPDGIEIPVEHAVAYLEWNPKIVFDDVDRPEVSDKKPRKKKVKK